MEDVNKLIDKIKASVPKYSSGILYKPTKKERSVLKDVYFWLGYPKLNMKVLPSGYIKPSGPCQSKRSQYCEGYPMTGLTTTHMGVKIIPSCHACWAEHDSF